LRRASSCRSQRQCEKNGGGKCTNENEVVEVYATKKDDKQNGGRLREAVDEHLVRVSRKKKTDLTRKKIGKGGRPKLGDTEVEKENLSKEKDLW